MPLAVYHFAPKSEVILLFLHTILSRPNSGPSQVLITRKNEIQLLDLSISEYMEIFLSYFLFLFSHVERIHICMYYGQPGINLAFDAGLALCCGLLKSLK